MKVPGKVAAGRHIVRYFPRNDRPRMGLSTSMPEAYLVAITLQGNPARLESLAQQRSGQLQIRQLVCLRFLSAYLLSSCAQLSSKPKVNCLDLAFGPSLEGRPF